MRKTIEILANLEKQTKESHRTEIFVVGGFVRDLLRRKSNNDLDIVVRHIPLDEVAKRLAGHGKVKRVTIHHVANTDPVNCVLFKAHGEDSDVQITQTKGAKKGVNGSASIKQDSNQRDFTINAMYLPINKVSYNNVIDFHGGKNDIKARQILTVGSAKEKFYKSPIRIMRAFSLAARTKYTISQHVKTAISENVHLLSSVPKEAIRAELEEIILSSKPSVCLKLMQKLGVLKVILPELDVCASCSQDKKYHKYNVFNHLVYTCDNIQPNLVLRLAGLLHDIGKPAVKKNIGGKITFYKHEVVGARMAGAILKNLKFDNKTIKEVTHLIRMHMYHYTREYTDAAIRRFITNAGIEKEHLDNIEEFPLFQIRSAERLGNGFKKQAVTPRQKDFQERIVKIFNESSGFTVSDLAINGNELMETFKMRPSKQVGDILKHLVSVVLEKPELNNKIDLLHEALDYITDREKGNDE